MDQLYKQIVNLQHQCNDWIDDSSSSEGRSLQQEIQRLEDEAQARKNPRSLEDRAQSAIRLTEKAAESGAMSHPHADEMCDQLEQIINQLRKM